MACLWEATARKAGNVHRYRDFADLTYLDFVLSAAAIVPAMERAVDQRLGQTVLDAILATRRLVRTNTNLGMVLLLAPLAAVPVSAALRPGVAQVLQRTDAEDAKLVYEAIRFAVPGGLGKVPNQDVAQQPTSTLLEVMSLAQDRDQVARQYVTGFAHVFEEVIPALEQGFATTGSLEGGIVFGQLTLLARFPDSLIARKCGLAEAEEISGRAAQVMHAGWPREPAGWDAFHAFDAHLRARGNQRNPGTTADLLAAGLFVLLRQTTLPLPCTIPWTAGFDHE
jgi:triphosphoribosyl-dephospho-CoA synthase